jgi:hypothetical protein
MPIAKRNDVILERFDTVYGAYLAFSVMSIYDRPAAVVSK